jgi:S-adenosylmethionine:diacylglycerol 3-amino-3-carboxypropyl transferase
MTTSAGTPWERGRFDAGRGPRKVLFGRMYEDSAVELGAFRPGGRVLCIASAGCTARALAPHHEVVALDINPDQLAYAQARIAGAPAIRGTADRVMAFGRGFAPFVGWSSRQLRAFLELDDPAAQIDFWRRHLDTRRFRAAVDALLSVTALRAVYASPFLRFLPPHLGAVMRARMERCFARHPNRSNPYARALLLGELGDDAAPSPANKISLVHADAAAWLEAAPAGSLHGLSLSNILDGADEAYRARLVSAVKHAAAPAAVVVLRSFAEPALHAPTNRAAEDRSMLWGSVDVRPAIELDAAS